MAITAQAGEYRSKVGLDSLYIAEVTQDDATAYTADTPEYFAPAAEASQEPSTSTETQYADDQAYEVMFSEGETKITVEVTGLPSELKAKITGKKFDAASGRIMDNNAVPPYMALSFRSKKSNGSYRYYQFLKGRFDVPKEEATTQSDKPEPKTTKLTFTAIRTIHQWTVGAITDTFKKVEGDTDTVNFSATGWFSQVQTPAAAAFSALALSSSVPADAATGVSVSANQTLTFNNALTGSAVNNVVLLAATGAVKVAATITIDTARKVITINPDSNLGASADYIITYAVTDIYGQTLSGAINFTTA